MPPRKKHDYQYVGGQDTWKALKSGKRPWKLIESKADFEALTLRPHAAEGVGHGPGRHDAPREAQPRPASTRDPPKLRLADPFADPLNRNVPSLAVMTRAAINCLDDNPNGFYLMIEGGAVDWANHANEPDRMIEEQIDFRQGRRGGRRVGRVAWRLERHAADPYGRPRVRAALGAAIPPKSPFNPLEDRGAGKLPGMKYNSHGHSNSLVPLYARGPGSRRFAALVKGNDATAAAAWHHSGQYVDNTDVFAVMRAEMERRSERPGD